MKVRNIVKAINLKENFTIMPNAVMKDKNLSNAAVGLLLRIVYLPSDFELTKEWLYTKWKTDGRRKVTAQWEELEKGGYIYTVPFRIGKAYCYRYLVSALKLTEEEKVQYYNEVTDEMKQKGIEENVNIWGVHFEQSNLNSSKRTGNQLNIFTKEINIKVKDDEEKATKSGRNSSILSTMDQFEIIERLKEKYKDVLKERSFKAVVSSVLATYEHSWKEGNEPIKNLESYLIRSLDNKVTELESRRVEKTKTAAQPKKEKKTIRTENVPDWLDEMKAEEKAKKEKQVAEEDDFDVEAARRALEAELKQFKKE